MKNRLRMRAFRPQRLGLLAGILALSITVATVSLPSLSLAISRPHSSTNFQSSLQAASFIFGAGGDIGANSAASASLTAVANSGASFFLALGDLSYDEVTPESAWCDYVKQRVGATYPFELIVGNHEETTAGPDGFIDNYAACLPDRLGVTGIYAHQYYFDYPPAAPLARFILIDPALYRGAAKANYCTNGDSANCSWLKARIDEAKSKGLWTVVGMHKNCITMGDKSCEIGAPLLNALVERKVDIILQGHDHGYQRSKQLSLGGSCSGIAANAYNAGCVVDDGKDGVYTRGAGPVLAIVANVGRSSYSLSTSDPEAPYFSTWMDPSLNSKGFLKFTVSPDSIDAQFVAGTGSYADHFTIGGANSPTPTVAAPTPTPVASATPVSTPASTPTIVPTTTPTPIAGTHTYTFTAIADSYVVSNQRNKNFGTAATLRVDTSPATYSFLRFDVRGLAEPVVSARVLVYALSGSSTGYEVAGIADNSWTETDLTSRNAPPMGPTAGSSGAVVPDTWSAADVTSLVAGNGLMSLALAGTTATAISLSSREWANPPLLVVTTGSGMAAAATAGVAEPELAPAPEPPADADGDGLPDAGEHANGTDPASADTDGDGLPDLWEVEAGLDPRTPTGAVGSSGAGGDPDGDGITNLAEYTAQTDPWLPAVDDTPDFTSRLLTQAPRNSCNQSREVL